MRPSGNRRWLYRLTASSGQRLYPEVRLCFKRSPRRGGLGEVFFGIESLLFNVLADFLASNCAGRANPECYRFTDASVWSVKPDATVGWRFGLPSFCSCMWLVHVSSLTSSACQARSSPPCWCRAQNIRRRDGWRQLFILLGHGSTNPVWIRLHSRVCRLAKPLGGPYREDFERRSATPVGGFRCSLNGQSIKSIAYNLQDDYGLATPVL
jgi:hypothetical protein